jgi:hypothetical protein
MLKLTFFIDKDLINILVLKNQYVILCSHCNR